MANRKPLQYPRYQAWANDETFLNGGTITFYDAGTTNKRNVYQDAALTTTAPNPVTLNSRGEPQSAGGTAIDIYLDDQPYKIVSKDSSGTTVHTIDNYIEPPATQLNQPETLSDLQGLNTSTFNNDAVVYLRGRSSAGDGGEGHFRWDSSDLSTEVGNDTQKGIYVPPDSDTSGASGAWVRQLPLPDVVSVEMFGAKGDSDGTSGNGTDDWAAFDAACNLTVRDDGGVNQYAPKVLVGEKIYRLSKTLNLKKIVRIQGQGGNIGNRNSSLLRFDDNTDGIVVNRQDTLGDGLDPNGSTTTASGSVIDGVSWRGGGTSGHGLRMRARAVIRNFSVLNFGEDGLHLVASSGGGAESLGNINNWKLENGRVTGCGRDGVFVDGADSNIGYGQGVDCSSNGRWGIYDSSFLGCVWAGCHTNGNGTARTITNITQANPAVVTTNSAHGLETGETTYIENVSGMTEINGTAAQVTKLTDTTFELDGVNSSGFSAYSSGGDAWDGSAYIADSANAESIFIGPYAEQNQAFMYLANRCIMLRGQTPVARKGSGIYIHGGNGIRNLTVDGDHFGGSLAPNSNSELGLSLLHSDDTGIEGFSVRWNGTTQQYELGVTTRGVLGLLGDANSVNFGRGTAPTRGLQVPDEIFVGAGAAVGRALAMDRAKPDGSGSPTETGEHAQGDIVLHNAGEAGQPVGWQCTSAGTPGTFTPFGQVGHRTNAGDPNSSVTPNFVGEELLDTTNSKWYKSTGTTNSDWAALN